MPVADFTQPRGGCDVTLQKILIEADPANDANTFKVYVQMPLASRAEAEVVQAMLPGLADTFDRAGEDDNWKSTLSVKPSDSYRVVLAAKEAGSGVRQGVVKAGDPVIQGQAELVEMRASQSKRARVVLCRFVFRGQGASVAERLAEHLGRSVAMSFEQLQGVLDFPKTASKAPPLRPGMIVAASASDGSQVVGRLVEIDGDELSLQECGTEVTVDAATVITAFAFSDDSETSAALSDYVERCDRRGVAVSWAALGRVLGLQEGRQPAQGVRVTADDVEAAVATLGSEERPLDRPSAPEGEDATDEGEDVRQLRLVPPAATPSRRKPRAAALA